MDSLSLSQSSDPCPCEGRRRRSSSLSDDSATSAWRPEEEEEEEKGVILAATRPKKRAGRRVFKETRHPVFRGVRRRKNDKWVCEAREPKTQARVWLGTYPTPEMAARAHDVAALAFRGRRACLNFADSARRLPIPASARAADVRAAAAEAAEIFRPPEHGGDPAREAADEKSGGAPAREVEAEKRVFFVDEEAFFDAPRLFADLAEGLLLPPPVTRFSGFDDVDGCADVSLWSYSV